jgi:hypothetical protein
MKKILFIIFLFAWIPFEVLFFKLRGKQSLIGSVIAEIINENE